MRKALRVSGVLFALAGAVLVASIIHGAVTTGEDAIDADLAVF